MHILRYLLIITSFGTAAFLTYICSTERVHAPATIAFFIVACVVNGIYLARTATSNWPAKSRISVLFNLWLDAKESELKARSGQTSKSEG